MSLGDFLKAFKSIWGGLAAAAAAGPLLVWGGGLQPPWPDSAAGITSVFCAVSILVGYALSRLLTTPRNDSRAVRRLILVGVVCLLSGLAGAATYLWAYSSRVVSETVVVKGSETTARFVIGTELLPGLPNTKVPDIERLRDHRYEPAAVWTAASLRASRLLLLASFLATFFLLTLGSSLLAQFDGAAPKASK